MKILFDEGLLWGHSVGQYRLGCRKGVVGVDGTTFWRESGKCKILIFMILSSIFINMQRIFL